MRKHIRRDLIKYVDYEIVRDFERQNTNRRVERSLQSIFTELIRQLDELESTASEKDGRIQILSEALTRQQRAVIRQNEAEDRRAGSHDDADVVSRNDRIRQMYAEGFSQRQIADEVGLCKSRVKAIIDQTGHPLFALNVRPENFRKFAKKRGWVSREERDLKICEWWDMGYTQEQIAKGTGLSQGRVAQIVLKKCTQVQKINTLKKKSEKNNFHRNTQARIEKIRKVAPWLAEQCESREITVRAAEKIIEDKLGKPAKGSAARKQKAEKEKEAVV